MMSCRNLFIKLQHKMVSGYDKRNSFSKWGCEQILYLAKIESQAVNVSECFKQQFTDYAKITGFKDTLSYLQVQRWQIN